MSLKGLISGFKVPCIMIPKLAEPFFRKPVNLTLPVFAIPAVSIKAIEAVLPDLTSLPTLLSKNNVTQLMTLPELSLKLPNVTAAASLGGTAASLGVFVSTPAGGVGSGVAVTSYASLTIPGLPRLPSLNDLAAVDTTKLLSFMNVLGVVGGEGGLAGLLPDLDLPSLGLPPLQASLAKLNLTNLGLNSLDLSAVPALAGLDLMDMSSLASLPELATDAWTQLSGSFGTLRTIFGSTAHVTPPSTTGAPAAPAVSAAATTSTETTPNSAAGAVETSAAPDDAPADEEPVYGPETAYMNPQVRKLSVMIKLK